MNQMFVELRMSAEKEIERLEVKDDNNILK